MKKWLHAAAAAKSLQLRPILCDRIDGSPPGSAVPGILQARTLDWVAISFSNAWKWKGKVKLLSCVWLFATLRTAAYQAPLSIGFSRQEDWSGVPLPSPSWLHRKCTNAEKDWKKDDKGMTEDELVGWHHWLDGHEFAQALGVGNGQGSLACCSPWGHKESDMTELTIHLSVHI